MENVMKKFGLKDFKIKLGSVKKGAVKYLQSAN